MRHKIVRHDLGEGVTYAVVERPDLVLVVVNQPEIHRRLKRLLRLPRFRRRRTDFLVD